MFRPQASCHENVQIAKYEIQNIHIEISSLIFRPVALAHVQYI
jgi:hypothetical protein